MPRWNAEVKNVAVVDELLTAYRTVVAGVTAAAAAAAQKIIAHTKLKNGHNHTAMWQDYAKSDLVKLHASAQDRAVWDNNRNTETQNVKGWRDIAVNLRGRVTGTGQNPWRN